MIAIDGERPCSWPRWSYQWYCGEPEATRPGTIDRGPGSSTRLVPIVKFRLTQTPVTSAALFRMIEENRLALDEDVNVRLRSWKLPDSEVTRTQR